VPGQTGPGDRAADHAVEADAEAPGGEVDPVRLERSAELLELPELAGWFVDPGLISEEALALLQARESRLVVSDQIKGEREAAIVDAVIDRHFTPEARRRWARRLVEMALIFRSTAREETAGRVTDVGAALADDRIPWQRVINARGEVSPRAEPGGDRVQRRLLEREGVRFDVRGRVSLEIFGWKPRARVR